MHERVTANRLAALATALDDAVFAETEGLSESAVAALLVIRRSEPVPIQEVARAVGLTHSATVRLIDRLEEGWLVRRLTRRGREVSVETTARGKRRASQLQDRRLAVAEALLGHLDPDEQETFAGLLDKLLAATVDGRPKAERVCRLCDHGQCRGAGCPVDAAAERIEKGAPVGT